MVSSIPVSVLPATREKKESDSRSLSLAMEFTAAYPFRSLKISLLMLLIGQGLGPLICGTEVSAQAVDETVARRRLVERDIVDAGITNPGVIQAMLNTPRHEFVPAKLRSHAYYDMSLPIGEHQTISSPFIVAYMTEALDPQPTDRVLEIGTGSGYQAAILSPLVSEVYTIEIIETLGRRATRTLSRLKYMNVHVKIGDGFLGWPEKAPFDKIIVTCSPESVPQPLIEQLAEGGKMVIPVGQRYQQVLYVYKKEAGELKQEALQPTLFVPMTGKAEQQRTLMPDPSNPAIVDGSFEQTADGEHELGGWFYQRQVSRWESEDVPDGSACAHFSNQVPGRSSHAMQGFGIDGSQIRQLELSAWVKTVGVRDGPSPDMAAAISLSFYDAQRAPLGQQWLGPWRGTSDWQQVSKSVRVPVKAREAILRMGLFGAVGELFVDDVKIDHLQPVRR